jgi:hypothetical protein
MGLCGGGYDICERPLERDLYHINRDRTQQLGQLLAQSGPLFTGSIVLAVASSNFPMMDWSESSSFSVD